MRNFFKILFQEELREMREQSIDPQAEQEIINSIEEVYFSNDSFDMVQHELEVRHSPSERASTTHLLNDDSLPGSTRPPLREILIIPANPPHFRNSDNANIAFLMWINVASCALNLVWLAELKLFLTWAAASYASAEPHAHCWRPDWWIASAQQKKGVKSH